MRANRITGILFASFLASAATLAAVPAGGTKNLTIWSQFKPDSGN